MIIVIDGPDGSGKTTLSDELIRRGFKYHHCTRDSNKYSSNVAFYEDFIKFLEDTKASGTDLVIDRCYFSNIVYSKVFEDSDILTFDQKKAIERLVDAIVVALPERSFYLDWFDKVKSSREELYNIMHSVYDLFEKIIVDANYRKSENIDYNNIIRYDMTQCKIEEVSKFIDSVIERC